MSINKKNLFFGVNVVTGKRDWSITEGSPDGPVYTLEEAKREFYRGNVGTCSEAFARLVDLGWDMDALKREYREHQRATEWLHVEVLTVEEFIDQVKEQRRRDIERN